MVSMTIIPVLCKHQHIRATHKKYLMLALKRSLDCLLYTKKETNTFTSRVNVLNENTVKTEGILITLYVIMSSMSEYMKHGMNKQTM